MDCTLTLSELTFGCACKFMKIPLICFDLKSNCLATQCMPIQVFSLDTSLKISS